MRSKAPLVMIEQIVMVMVFALAAVFCVQTFVLSENLSRKNIATDRAVLEAQNVAEQLKEGGLGEDELQVPGAIRVREDCWQIGYDVTWKVTDTEMAYYVEIIRKEAGDYLWQANVAVYMADGTPLFELPVAGQKQTEVDDNA